VTHIVHDEVEGISNDVATGRYRTAPLIVPCRLYGTHQTLWLPKDWESARWTIEWPGQAFPYPRDRHAQTFVVWRLPEDRAAWVRLSERTCD